MAMMLGWSSAVVYARGRDGCVVILIDYGDDLLEDGHYPVLDWWSAVDAAWRWRMHGYGNGWFCVVLIEWAAMILGDICWLIHCLASYETSSTQGQAKRLTESRSTMMANRCYSKFTVMWEMMMMMQEMIQVAHEQMRPKRWSDSACVEVISHMASFWKRCKEDDGVVAVEVFGQMMVCCLRWSHEDEMYMDGEERCEWIERWVEWFWQGWIWRAQVQNVAWRSGWSHGQVQNITWKGTDRDMRSIVPWHDGTVPCKVRNRTLHPMEQNLACCNRWCHVN